MPKMMHDKLMKEAKKKFPGNKERQESYVYGTMHKIEKSKSRKGKK